MNLVTWDPFRDLGLLQSDMNRLFERFGDGERARFMPALDIHEEDDHFVVRCDLPGMGEDDVNIEVEDRVLRISGERRDEHEDKQDGYRRVERSYGRFERMLTLPEGVDAEAIQASFDKGVLELTVPKPEERKPRRITIGGKRQQTIEGAEAKHNGNGDKDKKSLKDRVLSHT
jgi:HSP20 family protein